MTDYAVEYRSPSDLAEPEIDQAEQSLSLVIEIPNALLARLPAEVRSPE